MKKVFVLSVFITSSALAYSPFLMPDEVVPPEMAGYKAVGYMCAKDASGVTPAYAFQLVHGDDRRVNMSGGIVGQFMTRRQQLDLLPIMSRLQGDKKWYFSLHTPCGNLKALGIREELVCEWIYSKPTVYGYLDDPNFVEYGAEFTCNVPLRAARSLLAPAA